jgi:hypothetical protein|tara:strand:+ start:103 stop:672 length:570 start_codon:yes stop_codon:yes gene_type:complete
MDICEICDTNYTTNESICNVCNFPLSGTNQEQIRFRAKQIKLKSDVKYSLKRVNAARVILLVIGCFFSLITYYLYNLLALVPIILYINIGLSAFFIVCAIIAGKVSKTAITAPFALILMYYTIMILLDSSYIFQGGLIWFSAKVFILFSLGYACFSVWKAEYILKKNPYLASEMGFGKNKNTDIDLLDD